MFVRSVGKRAIGYRGIATLVTPGQGIVSHEAIKFYQPYLNNTQIKELVNQADEITKMPISSIFSADPKLDFQKTSLQQPMIILLNAIQKQILKDEYGVDLYSNGRFDFSIGHSIGEITNLTLQGCISFSDGISIAQKRGLLMEEQVALSNDEYKMFALMIDRKSFEEFYDALMIHTSISVSNINSDEQLVISGQPDDIELAIAILSGRFKIRKNIDLQVSIPFHNELLSPITEELSAFFAETETQPELKIESIANLDGSRNKLSKDYIDKILQVTSRTVNFKQCIDTLLVMKKPLKFVSYSSVNAKLIERYLKAKDIKFESYSLDSVANIEAFVNQQ